MDNLNASLDRVEGMIHQMMNMQRESKEKVRELEAQLKEQKVLLKQKEEEIDTLKDRNKVLSLARSLDGEESAEKRELKLKINEIMREVDKCIGLMNQ